MRTLLATLLIVLALTAVAPALADDQVNYVSQPESLTVFLNGIAFARDTLRVPGNATVHIVLPETIFQDTLIVRSADGQIPSYRVSKASGQTVLQLTTQTRAEFQDLTLQYLTTGISWTPLYTLEFGQDTTDKVGLSFFAQLQNDVFTLDGVDVQLAAGRVDASQQLSGGSAVSPNQYIAGYDDRQNGSPELGTSAVTIQSLYPFTDLSAQPGDALYLKLHEGPLTARRLLLWNASSDLQPIVIYKVLNDTDLPFAEGVVRSYQDGLFVGGDLIEFTPPGSEGSVTVGNLQDVRTHRDELVTALPATAFGSDTQHEVTLTLSNYGKNAVEIQVVDTFPETAKQFTFSQEAAREPGNLLRWTVTVKPAETVDLHYSYKTD